MPQPREPSPAASPPALSARAIEALDDYLQHLASARGRSALTLRNYRRDLEGFFAFLAEHNARNAGATALEFDRAGRELAREHLGELRIEQERAPASVKRIASTIRAF
ncbi:MAG: site-specific integrase, partial [Chloroflexi bacterium]|nr:site-specific integrase [Chloroflexota bacterium]MQC28166.1 hypothetical protein [Chloroflexota bacterium]